MAATADRREFLLRRRTPDPAIDEPSMVVQEEFAKPVERAASLPSHDMHRPPRPHSPCARAVPNLRQIPVVVRAALCLLAIHLHVRRRVVAFGCALEA